MPDESTSAECSFESAFGELEEVVRQLEEGELSLEEAISLYERGQTLSRFCQEQLDRAELRVTQLETLPQGSVPRTRVRPPVDDAAC